MTLTPLRERFVLEYLVDLNPTAAAQRAGFTSKPEHTKGYQMLRIPEVREAVAQAMAERARRTAVTGDRVLLELAKIGFSDIRNFTAWRARPGEPQGRCEGDQVASPGYELWIKDSDEIDDSTAGAISEVRHYNGGGMRIKLHDKICALALMGRHVGMFGDRQQAYEKDRQRIEDMRLTEKMSRVPKPTRDKLKAAMRDIMGEVGIREEDLED